MLGANHMGACVGFAPVGHTVVEVTQPKTGADPPVRKLPRALAAALFAVVIVTLAFQRGGGHDAPSAGGTGFRVARQLLVKVTSPPPSPPPSPPCSNTFNGVVKPGNTYVNGRVNISGCNNVVGSASYVVTSATVIGSNNVIGGTTAASQATNRNSVRARVQL